MSLFLGALLCGCAPKEATPYFQMRGVVLAWDDVIHPETIDWMKIMKETGMNTISICGHRYDDEEYAQMKQNKSSTTSIMITAGRLISTLTT